MERNGAADLGAEVLDESQRFVASTELDLDLHCERPKAKCDKRRFGMVSEIGLQRDEVTNRAKRSHRPEVVRTQPRQLLQPPRVHIERTGAVPDEQDVASIVVVVKRALDREGDYGLIKGRGAGRREKSQFRINAAADAIRRGGKNGENSISSSRKWPVANQTRAWLEWRPGI
jgi:hypothetical protein